MKIISNKKDLDNLIGQQKNLGFVPTMGAIHKGHAYLVKKSKSMCKKTIVSIFSALKRAFPMKIDMMEKHPLGSQAFVPMKETTFLSFVAPAGKAPEINKIQSFIIPPKMGVNYKPGIWHFPLISTENTNFLVIDRKGNGENLIIHKFEKDKIFLEY